MAKNPTPSKRRIDAEREIGRRLRAARQEREVTQEELGNKLGITFQQVQKYEKGANRVALSTAIEAARILDIPVTRLIPELDGKTGTIKPTIELSAVDVSILKALEKIPEERKPVVRTILRELGE